MDLAVRATLQGWKFVYVGDLKVSLHKSFLSEKKKEKKLVSSRHIFHQVKSELPSSYKAYRYQQHRWACGPANLFKKMASDIIMAKVNSSFFMYQVSKLGELYFTHSKFQCISDTAEGIFSEEILFALQFLLREKDNIAQCHILLLLHPHPSFFLCTSSWNPKMGSVLHSISHHHPQLSWNPKV